MLRVPLSTSFWAQQHIRSSAARLLLMPLISQDQIFQSEKSSEGPRLISQNYKHPSAMESPMPGHFCSSIYGESGVYQSIIHQEVRADMNSFPSGFLRTFNRSQRPSMIANGQDIPKWCSGCRKNFYVQNECSPLFSKEQIQSGRQCGRRPPSLPAWKGSKQTNAPAHSQQTKRNYLRRKDLCARTHCTTRLLFHFDLFISRQYPSNLSNSN